MKELQYPFDAGFLIRKKKSIRKKLKKGAEGFIQKKIAILGGSTTAEIKDMLELFLLAQGIETSFYESEYGQYYQDAVFPNEKLEEFRPDIIYVYTTNKNVMQYPALEDSADKIETLLHRETEKFSGMWDRLFSVYKCPIIQNNFEMPFYRLLGNKDASDIHGAVNFLHRLNTKFYEYAQAHDSFFICDINYISADYGLKEWSDPFFWNMYKYALNVSAVPSLAFNVSNIIKSVFGKNKKGFVLDLDNTLWGGVAGDSGVEGIELGPEEPNGRAYSEFQRYIKAHKQLGVLLNIDSKNDEENAIAGLGHPDSELGTEDFTVIKANWEPKDKNFAQIAHSLNLLPESLVFVDDNPAERLLVTENNKGVVAPEMGDVHRYIQNIDRSGFFEVTALSADDASRDKMYKENLKRQEYKAGFSNYSDYLLSLDMKAVIEPFKPFYYLRIAQLVNKSNQFNLTARRYTQNEIEEAASNELCITLYGKLADRFGDNGLVSVIIGTIQGSCCSIDLWVMSCRVLKRNLEYAMMDALVQQCRERGIKILRGLYCPTAKNSMVRDFYQLMGFDKKTETQDGRSEWVYEIPAEYRYQNEVIDVEGSFRNETGSI